MRHNTNANDDRSFGEAFTKNVGDTSWILDWIEGHFDIEDVYDEDVITDYVKKNLNPEDVFDDNDLEKWAENNGFVKKD